MPSNNSKYTSEFRERTCKHILDSGKSAARVGEELGSTRTRSAVGCGDTAGKIACPAMSKAKGLRRQQQKKQGKILLRRLVSGRFAYSDLFGRRIRQYPDTKPEHPDTCRLV